MFVTKLLSEYSIPKIVNSLTFILLQLYFIFSCKYSVVAGGHTIRAIPLTGSLANYFFVINGVKTLNTQVLSLGSAFVDGLLLVLSDNGAY